MEAVFSTNIECECARSEKKKEKNNIPTHTHTPVRRAQYRIINNWQARRSARTGFGCAFVWARATHTHTHARGQDTHVSTFGGCVCVCVCVCVWFFFSFVALQRAHDCPILCKKKVSLCRSYPALLPSLWCLKPQYRHRHRFPLILHPQPCCFMISLHLVSHVVRDSPHKTKPKLPREHTPGKLVEPVGPASRRDEQLV